MKLASRRTFVRTGAALAAAAALGSDVLLAEQQAAPVRGADMGHGAIGPSVHAQTTLGPVHGYIAGHTAPAPGNILTGTIVAFKGIPYGADTATTRFAAPRPPTPWTDVRSCTQWAPRAPQVTGARPAFEDAKLAPDRPGYHLPPDEGIEGEDCLHLNVWTPALPENDHPKSADVRLGLPVMVYIHGGAYSNGTANAMLYDGTSLARRGAVVVTVNHRLNLFGYLYLAELLPGQGFEDSGNAGQLDLVLALQWVRDNIAKFGGDPGCVTIFGQSGGGAKCATLMAQPPAAGLFHRVITMSGQQVTGSVPAHATERARGVLKALELDGKPAAEAAQALRTLPMKVLQAATRAGGYYGPVTDGRSLPRDPFSPDAPPLSAHIPMMLGNTHDETRVLIGGGQPALFSLTWETLPAALEKNATFLKSDTVSLPVPEVIAKYREWHPDYSASDVFFAVTTDSRSWRGEVIEAERRAAQPGARSHTFVYQLNWKSPVDGGKFGAPHTLDLAFAFDNLVWSAGMVGQIPPPHRGPGSQFPAQDLADIICTGFLAFARTGNPNGVPPGAIVGHASSLTPWPAYDLQNRATMIFDLPSRVENDPRGRERRYLGQVPYVQPGT